MGVFEHKGWSDACPDDVMTGVSRDNYPIRQAWEMRGSGNALNLGADKRKGSSGPRLTEGS